MELAIVPKESINPEQEPVDLRVSRFSLPDINDMGAWLITRLRPKFPHLQDNQLIAMFRGRIDNNECLFRRTKHAVAMAEVVHESLSPAPSIVERFVLIKDKEKWLDEGIEMYGEIERWAAGIGATEIEVGGFTDVSKADIQKKLGRLYIKETMIAKVGK